MRTARLLQVVTDNDRRGAQVFALDLGRSLGEMGWHVETMALTAGRVGGLDLDPLGRRRHSLRALWRLRDAALRFDIVLAHGSTTLPMTALAVTGLGRRFVYRQISDSLYWAPNPMRRARVRAALNRAAGVVALWEGAAEVLTDRFGVSETKLHVVPNGVRSSDWCPASEDDRYKARRAIGIPDERSVVAFVGSLSEEKGPDLAVESIAAVPGTHLLVVGDGPQTGNVKALAAGLIEERVTFLGSTRKMREIYAAADILIFPSRGGDSMPAVLIEAGLMRIPTVATCIGAVSSMIDDEVTGVVVDSPSSMQLGNELRRLVAEPARRAAMGRAARERFLERFDMSTVARQWADVLEGVLHDEA